MTDKMLHQMNFYDDEDFDRVVYTAEANGVVEWTFGELCREYARETETPYGIGPEYFVEGAELCRWKPENTYVTVKIFDTEEQAEHALYLTFKADMLATNDGTIVHETREAAQAEFEDWLQKKGPGFTQGLSRSTEGFIS